jgi:hypothetical protein
MFLFEVSAGEFLSDGELLSKDAYAGNGLGYNNPEMENVPNVGPLPRGMYTMVRIYDDPETGPFTIELAPDPEDKMFGRSLFRIHGVNPERPRGSSKGCICLEPESLRITVFNSGDHRLMVV